MLSFDSLSSVLNNSFTLSAPNGRIHKEIYHVFLFMHHYLGHLDVVIGLFLFLLVYISTVETYCGIAL